MEKFIKGKHKKIITNILSIVLMMAAFTAVFGYVVPAYNHAKEVGAGIGDKAGTLVGNVIGSYDGVTKGVTAGKEAGREEGESAKDINSVIDRFSQIGNLEVLEAGVKLKDVNTLGDDYAALFLLKGVATYSVDLKNAEINAIDANTIEILLAPINVEIYIDESETEKLAEYQKHSWSKSAKDGFTEYMNTRTESDRSIKDTMMNYSALTEEAQNAAMKQIKGIAEAATGNRKKIMVSFREGEQADE